MQTSFRTSYRSLLKKIGWTRHNQKSDVSSRSKLIRHSNIRDAARLVSQISGVVNLGQGLPEAHASDLLKQAACDAINFDYNQYSNTWGYPELRAAIARKMLHYNGIKADPETEITVTCGATEAINASLLAVVNPGDEVIIFEPFYENYHPNVIIAGAKPRYVKLHAPDWKFDYVELAKAFNGRTRAIIVNTPHNPTGKVFTSNELGIIAKLCIEHDVIAITDEIYEYMVYDGLKHVSLATLPGMHERTITVSGLSKTFSITGWRLGYVVAVPKFTDAIRRIHDYLTMAAPSPLQIAAITALNLPDEFYTQMRDKYQHSRDKIMDIVKAAGFKFSTPQGTYYLFTDASELGFANDKALWEKLLNDYQLATVAGYCFYRPGVTSQNIRFCYAKSNDTLKLASERLLEFSKSRTLND